MGYFDKPKDWARLFSSNGGGANDVITTGGTNDIIHSYGPFRLSDGMEFPVAQYIHQRYGKFCSKIISYRPDRNRRVSFTDIVEKLRSEFTKIFEKHIPGDEGSRTQVWEYKTHVAESLIIFMESYLTDDADIQRGEYISWATIYATEGCIHNVDRIYSVFAENEVDYQYSMPNNVHLVVTTPRGYDTMEFELPKADINVEINYGKDFKPVHEKIMTELSKKNGKGLVLLHGTPGTGKTHYLRYIASTIQNKKILFVPPFLTDFITSPDMIPFLVENSNSILFIEDAERVVTDRNLGGSSGVSNILNITDGILSEILNIQIVATFNMDKQKIDSALLRKGRLIAEHCFDALSKEDAQVVLDSLGKQYTATGKMTLTEIYNIDEVEYKSSSKQTTRIGFGQ